MDREGFERRFGVLSSGMETAELDSLLEQLERVELEAGEVLLTHGTPTDALYLLYDGSLTASIGVGADERDVGVIERGEYIGEISLLDAGPATATVRSEIGATVLELSHGRFEAFRRAHPAAGAALLHELGVTLAQRIRGSGRRLAGLDRHGAAELAGSDVEAEDLPASFAAMLRPVVGGTDVAAQLADVADVRTVDAGGTIIAAGERATTLQLLLGGRAVRRGEEGDLVVLAPGNLLATEPLFGAIPGTGVIAVDPVTVAAVESVP